jgi:hypothetical protein
MDMLDPFETLLTQMVAARQRNETLPPCGDSPSNYDKFLEAILKGKHPPFCELIWTGEAYYITLQIHFQKAPERVKPPGPEGQVFRQDAWRRFKRVKPAEQKMIWIRVFIRDGLPVTAEISTRPEATGVLRMGTEQLMEFQNP